MSSLSNMFSRKSKDKNRDTAKSDSKTSTLIFSTDGATTSAGSALTSYKSKYKSNSKGSSSKTEITVTTNETISKEQGLTILRKFDHTPIVSVTNSSKTITSTYKSTEIQKSISTKTIANPLTKDAVAFNTRYVSPYITANIPTFNTPALLPPASKTTTSTYQSPYRNSPKISLVGNKKSSFVSANRTPVSTINPPTTKIWNPMTSITNSKPVTHSWQNNSSLTPNAPSSVLHKKPSEAAVVKSKRKLSPGVVYIFHNDKFDSSDKEFREGSTVDVRLLNDTFQNFKMLVKIYNNLTVKEVNNAVQKIERKDFGGFSCIVIVILTHGTRYGTVAAKDGSYSIDDNVLFPILRNSSLRSKPKLFFIQACKGSMEPGIIHKDAMQPSGVPEEILKCYSTFEGYVAYRTEKGTFFIKSLCELLQEHGKTKSIKDIMDLVIRRVKEKSGNKQIPSYETTLTEPYIFGDYL